MDRRTYSAATAWPTTGWTRRASLGSSWAGAASTKWRRSPGVSRTRNQSIAAGFDHALGSNWLTDFRFGWFRYRVNVDPGGGNVNPATDAGIPGLNIDDFSRGMPALLLNGYGPGGNTGNQFNFGYALQFARCNCPLRQNERQFQFVNNWTKLQGNHTIKFGADIRHARNLRIPSDRHRAGELQFNAARTQGPTGGGSALASFLLGDVSVFERYVSSVTDAEERQNRWFFYGQDQWKATRKLTINYGLRWEIYRPQTVTGAGKGGFVDVDTGEVLIAGSQGVGLDLNVEGTLKTLGAAPGHRLPRHRQHRGAHGLRPRLRHRHLRFGLRAQRDAEPAGAGHPVAAAAAQLRCGLQLSRRGRRRSIRRRFSARQPTGPNGRPLLPNGVTAFILPKKLRLPTNDAWNLTVQHQLPGDMAVEAAYIGNKGTHVFAGFGGDYDFNQATIEGFGTLTTNQRKPFFNRFGWSQNFRYYGSDASNNYHAMQLKAEKRFSRGYSLLGHYTFSRAFNYTNTYYNIDADLAYGPNDNHRTHVFGLNGVWELPFGTGRRYLSDAGGALNAVIGGWQLAPSTPGRAGCRSHPAIVTATPTATPGWCRPDLVGEWKPDNQTAEAWFVTTPLAADGRVTPLTANGQTLGPWRRPERGTFGSVGRNRLLGPSFSQLDLSFFKNFVVTEDCAAQFRAEAFNLLNTVNLANPNTCVDCPGTAGTDHQHLPAGGDAPVAVRPAAGVLSGVRSHLLPSRRPRPAVACCARSTSCGEASPKLARSCASVGWATAGALKRRWWHGIYAERGRIPTHARRPRRLDRLWRLGSTSRPRHRIGPNSRIEGDLFEYSGERGPGAPAVSARDVYADYREMLAREELDLCDVVLPSDLHFAVAATCSSPAGTCCSKSRWR